MNQTKTPKLTIQAIAMTGAVVVATGTIVGSATSLYHIGQTSYPAAPWALPLAVDVTAAIAGLTLRARRTDRFALATLIGLTLFSAGLQWYETGSPIAMAVVFGAFLSFELAMRLVPESIDTQVPDKALSRGDQLRRRAAELDIKGRSKMTVTQLEEAITGKPKARKRATLKAVESA